MSALKHTKKIERELKCYMSAVEYKNGLRRHRYREQRNWEGQGKRRPGDTSRALESQKASRQATAV